MKEKDVVVFYNDRKMKRSSSIKSYVVSLPAEKRPKIQKGSVIQEINLDGTLEEIESIIVNTVKTAEKIQNLSIQCSNCACSCMDIFKQCLRIRIKAPVVPI